ncbi:hypothetical protein RGQ29_000158 [Quercus rubra]|uniref:Endonuclease/exonuclease/phosphatase domain-containing protein n=1 Tax=Quercus rubra TaxID=3512 RepID=A0AAN7G2T8_QUERU|nr:hypothetical protein RGQ29_000158 [Quercus rubra]
MRIMSWNCRGLGKSSAVLQCKKKALDLKPDILFLMETRLASGKGQEVWQKCGFSDGWEVPRVGFSGGFILAWLPRKGLQITYDSKNLIHINLLDNRGFLLSITFVYGHPDHAKRWEVWQQLRQLKQHAHPCWLCIGDFNQILSREEKLTFKNGNIVGADDFQQVLSDLQLCDLSASGQRFTWMNKREDEDFVMERLDRAFGSVEWVNKYPLYSLKNLPIVKSDHGPIIVDLEFLTPFRKRPFQFELMWLTHSGCKEMVHCAWEVFSIGSRANQLWNKLVNVKNMALEWNRNVFGKVEVEIRRKQSQLQHLQDSILSYDDVRRREFVVRSLRNSLIGRSYCGLKRLEQTGFYMGIETPSIFKQWLGKEGLKIE